MRKLPVIEAFTHALRSTKSNLSFAYFISWPWMAVLLPVLIATSYYVAARTAPNPQEVDVPSQTAGMLAGLLAMLAFSSIAVNWHRYVLRDEVPQSVQRLRLDEPVWRYFGNFFLIGLVMTLVMVALAVPLTLAAFFVLGMERMGDPGNYATLIFMMPIMLFVATMVFYRLGTKLPAIALGRRDFGLRDALRATAGNNLAVAGLGILYLVIGLAMAFVIALVGYALTPLGFLIAIPIHAVIQLGVNWVLTILGITLLTSLYGFFVEGRDF